VLARGTHGIAWHGNEVAMIWYPSASKSLALTGFMPSEEFCHAFYLVMTEIGVVYQDEHALVAG